ncbi:MAG: hypothetical protein PHG61_08235 [Candidatus Marinimicrobia bacterium]|nr:hypothetical protein [Candidatus Neomarinimicrobiota bacterium]
MMDDVERNVEIMVCAFIALGIIVVAGYFVFQKMEVADKIGVPDEQVKQLVSEEEYPNLMQYLLSQSIIYWIIALVIGFFAIIMLYIQLKENMWGLN